MRLLDESQLGDFSPLQSFRPRQRAHDPWVLACDAERLMIRFARTGPRTLVELRFDEVVSVGIADFHTAFPPLSPAGAKRSAYGAKRSAYGMLLYLRDCSVRSAVRQALPATEGLARTDYWWNIQFEGEHLLVEWAELEPGLDYALTAMPIPKATHCVFPERPEVGPTAEWSERHAQEVARGIAGLLAIAIILYCWLVPASRRSPPAEAAHVLGRQGATQIIWTEQSSCGHRGRSVAFRFSAVRQQRRVGGLYCQEGPYVIWDEDRQR